MPTKHEILDLLSYKDEITSHLMAEYLDCTPQAAAEALRRLRSAIHKFSMRFVNAEAGETRFSRNTTPCNLQGN
ncbi:MAG: hypothetical protein AB1478_03650 [Nitrospirota bacterium]